MDDRDLDAAGFFATHADAYDFEWERTEVWSLLPPLDGKQILDAGCGPGTVSKRLVEEGAIVVGVDAAEEMIQRARERCGDKATFYVGDLTSQLDSLDDGTFDVIACLNTLEHIDDWQAVFAEFARVLKPRGQVVVATSHPFYDFLEIEVESTDHVTAGTAQYPDIESFERIWNPDDAEPVPMYRRPLGEYFTPAIEAGFVIDDFLEPGPDELLDQHDEMFPPPYFFFSLQLQN